MTFIAALEHRKDPMENVAVILRSQIATLNLGIFSGNTRKQPRTTISCYSHETLVLHRFIYIDFS
jgi:hypothetical protein